MKYTKSIEHCTMNGLRMRSPVKSDVVGKTACKYILPILKASLEEVHGPCKSKTEYENGIQTYFIIPLNGGQNSSARQID